MKMYKLSNYKNGNLQHTQTSSDSNYLREVMQKEVSQILQGVGHVWRSLVSNNGYLIATCGNSEYRWRIEEI